MSNLTYGENRIKRIYINDSLVDGVVYNNKLIVGYKNSKNIADVQCYEQISGNTSYLANDQIWCDVGQDAEIRSRFATNGFDYTIKLNSTSYSESISVEIIDRGYSVAKITGGSGAIRVTILGKQIYSSSISSGVFEVRITDTGSSLFNNGQIMFYVNGTATWNTTYSHSLKNDKSKISKIKIDTSSTTSITANGGFDVCTHCQLVG